MKLLVSFLIGLCYAETRIHIKGKRDASNLQNIVQQVIENTPVNRDTKHFGALQGAVISMNKYGCWCYFSDDHGQGKHMPVDGLDKICQTLHYGYDCAIKDGKDENEKCVPWEVDYDSAVGGDTSMIPERCAQLNSDNCARRACIIEGSFIDNLMNFFLMENGGIDEDKKHSNGFQAAEICKWKSPCVEDNCECTNPDGCGNPDIKSIECCGHYPNRYPYLIKNGDRDCCGWSTYKVALQQCCDEATATVKLLGNC